MWNEEPQSADLSRALVDCLVECESNSGWFLADLSQDSPIFAESRKPLCGSVKTSRRKFFRSPSFYSANMPKMTQLGPRIAQLPCKYANKPHCTYFTDTHTHTFQNPHTQDMSQGRKNSININFLVRISRGYSWPLRPDAPGSISFSPSPGPQKNALFWCGRPRFSARTSMTRRVLEKLCAKKGLRWFFGP